MLTYRGKVLSNFQKRYLKYVIKSPLLFYAFLALGMLLFVCLSLWIRLDVIETYAATLSGNTVTVHEALAPASPTVYLYENRNDKIYKLDYRHIDRQSGATIFTIDAGSDAAAALPRDISVDVTVRQQTLLQRIFAKGGTG